MLLPADRVRARHQADAPRGDTGARHHVRVTEAGSIGASELLVVLLVALPVLALQLGFLWLVFLIIRDMIRRIRRLCGSPRGQRQA